MSMLLVDAMPAIHEQRMFGCQTTTSPTETSSSESPPPIRKSRVAGARPRPRKHSRSRSSSPHLVVGPNAINHLRAELARRDLSSPLIVASPTCSRLASRIQSLISNTDAYLASSADFATIACVTGRDCVISVGAESAHALAQSITLRDKVPYICIPTSYSGRDVRSKNFSGQEQHPSGTEYSIGEAAFRPTIIIYDNNLTSCAIPSASASTTPDVSEQPDPMQEDTSYSFLHLSGMSSQS